MFWLSAVRVLKMGLKNFWRNIWLSIATTGIMVLTIFSIASLVILNLIADVALQSLEQKIDVSVYFKTETVEDEIIPIKERIEALPETKEVVYKTKEEVLEEFKVTHQNNPLILDSLNELENNPLNPTLKIKAKKPEDFSVISDVLNEEQYSGVIEKFNYEDNRPIIEKLNQTTQTLGKAGIGVSIGFAVIAVLVMFNTVRLTMYTQKDEISIMRLVGANNTFITTPYIIEGILYGFFATILSTVFLFILLKYLSPILNRFLEYQADIFSYFQENILLIILLQLAFGAALGIVSSFIAIRRYLKV